MPSAFTKDPDSVLDYEFDWSSWLASGETISSYVVAADTGITVDSDSNDTDSVTVWLSSGTAGIKYTVGCKIVTSASRTVERSIKIRVKER
jgi:hypothetical protein